MNAPAPISAIDFAKNELVGVLLSNVVEQLEKQKNAWSMTSEKNQRAAIAEMLSEYRPRGSMNDVQGGR